MVNVVEDTFGQTPDAFTGKLETVKRFTLSNSAGMRVQLISYGATITSIVVPDAKGQPADVVLGYDDMAGYKSATNPYMGATVGRVCNRVANGRFVLDGKTIEVTRNANGKHQLHGGLIGFDKVLWQLVSKCEDGVTLTHESAAGHEGYPGKLSAFVDVRLTEDNCLHVKMEAVCQQKTVVNMTNHSYFNLAGHAGGKVALYEHAVMINADKLTETDADSIPTGNLTPLNGTPYDFRRTANLGERLTELMPKSIGFDDNYCVNLREGNAITTIARVSHGKSGRWMEVATNQPGVQFYTSNYYPDVEANPEAKPLEGKAGAKYTKHGAFCLETQKYPDAMNHENFPSVVLSPGERYSHEVIYKFGAEKMC